MPSFMDGPFAPDTPMPPKHARFAPFTDDELVELWDGLTMDDGLRYSVAESDQPTYKLASELYEEARRRGLHDGSPEAIHRWENTL